MVNYKNILIITLYIFSVTDGHDKNPEMKFHRYFPELFKGSEYRAEFIANKLLTENPIRKNINFLVTPWEVLQRNTDNGINPNLTNLNNIKVKDGFTVCSHDRYEELIPLLKKIGIKTLFTAAASKKRFPGINILAFPYFSRNGVGPAPKKNIFYSFVGNASHKCRKNIFKIKHPLNTVIIRRYNFHYAKNRDTTNAKTEEMEYRDVLSRSRYSLCPRGMAPGSYRFWESLQAGAIPVLISDDYLFPEGFDWPACIIKIKEQDVDKIPQILSGIPREKEELMRRNCLKAYQEYSGKKFVRIIREYFRKTN